MNHWMC